MKSWGQHGAHSHAQAAPHADMFSSPAEHVRGYVDHIIFQNQENGYTVLVLEQADGETVSCVGNLLGIEEGQDVELTGTWEEHASYGRQLKVTLWEEWIPEDEEGIRRYLGSGAVKGVGKALAERIVKRFGTETFRIIEEEPERLAEVKGISERKAQEIAGQINERRDLRKAVLLLQKQGLSLALSVRVYETYGREIYEILRTNPYRLAEEVRGIGFQTVDEMALRMGLRMDSEFRVRCGLLYVLGQAASDGHTCLPRTSLFRRAKELLQVEEELVAQSCMDLAVERKVVLKEGVLGEEEAVFVYLSSYYQMELHSAVLLHRLDPYGRTVTPPEGMEEGIRAVEEAQGFPLAETQREAVRTAAAHGVFLLTGGPGTGKTTTINALIRYFVRCGLGVFLAAPTGRAAKRMSEVTGMEAQTIHRMLEVEGGTEGKSFFARNEDNPLEADLVIVDESSMVDISLLHALLRALAPGTRLVLVGDVDQLPSVGPGTVLKDLIDSGAFAVTRLDRIFRQSGESDIVVNAHAINEGREVRLDNKSRDFFFMKRRDADRIISILIQLVRDKLPPYVDATQAEIQVLTPTRKGLVGVERLNRILQDQLNPPSEQKPEARQGDQMLRQGDKVMQTRNDYNRAWEVRNSHGFLLKDGKGVFNGDLGTVVQVYPREHTLEVEFDEGRVATYDFRELGELDLAYAMTVHKSQGSEYPAVVIPLMAGPRMLMNRNLLYTAVTRARKCVVLVGEEEVFREMAKNARSQRRFTGLKERVKELS